jgi:hypothetical protein
LEKVEIKTLPLKPLEQFAADMFSFAAKRKDISINPAVVVKPNEEWKQLGIQNSVPPNLQNGWNRAVAAANYFPISLEDKLRILGDVPKAPPETFPGEYDRYIEADTWIWIRHRAEPPTTDLETYILITSLVTRLIPWAIRRHPGTVILDVYEREMATQFDVFRAPMTKEEFNRKYGIF